MGVISISLGKIDDVAIFFGVLLYLQILSHWCFLYPDDITDLKRGIF